MPSVKNQVKIAKFALLPGSTVYIMRFPKTTTNTNPQGLYHHHLLLLRLELFPSPIKFASFITSAHNYIMCLNHLCHYVRSLLKVLRTVHLRLHKWRMRLKKKKVREQKLKSLQRAASRRQTKMVDKQRCFPPQQD